MQLERTEMRMIRWMCGTSLSERIPSKELRKWLGIEAVGDVIRRTRLRWYGHVERKDDADWVKACSHLEVEGTVPPGRPKKTWKAILTHDMQSLGINQKKVSDRTAWRRAIRRTRAHPEQTGDSPYNRICMYVNVYVSGSSSCVFGYGT